MSCNIENSFRPVDCFHCKWKNGKQIEIRCDYAKGDDGKFIKASVKTIPNTLFFATTHSIEINAIAIIGRTSFVAL